MITNLPLSKSDEAILNIIVEELSEQNIEITAKNIRKHRLFAKIDQKALFSKDACSINQIGLRFKQQEPDKFSVEFSGVNLDLSNTINCKFLEEIFSKVASTITLFSKVTEKLDLQNKRESLTDKSLDNFLNEFSKIWKKN
ncbi:hypothetical protein [Parabacteroides provencensis]|uniref:hypothetical protein n=1 Tax=Parabacteroides provencensis TaxID=1944636 RepID=UPI000C1526FF|nr:hypothetical protein [Parabacteroides provencensis]